MEYGKRRVKRLVFIVAGAAMALFILLYALINAQIRPALMQMAQTRVHAEASIAMRACVLELLSQSEQGTSFVTVHKTQDQISYAELNSITVNMFSARCVLAANDKLTQLGKQGVDLPVGTASGIPLFAGRGPMLRMYFFPEGAIRALISSEFRSAGINQTLYRIELTLLADISIVLPGMVEVDTVTLSIPIAEEVIAGQVPDVYTSVADQEDLLYLIPGTRP